MSNFLSVAAVTATLRRQLQQQLDIDVTGAMATAQRPDETETGGMSNDPHVNIYLYQVVANASLRNHDLPSRRGDASLVQRPRAALDLHYLLTFHGDDKQYLPQRMLGSVVRFLHASPILTRDAVHDAVAATGDLALCDLEAESELVRFTPLPMSLEELSKLWSVFFQTRYTLSVAYSASVVFLEGTEAPPKPRPVERSNIVVQQFAPPVIDEVSPPAVSTGDTLVIRGRNLRGDVTRVRIGSTLFDPSQIANDDVELPVTTAIPAGVRTLQVVHGIAFETPDPDPLHPHPGFESNSMPFVRTPAIVSTAAAHNSTQTTVIEITLVLDPPPNVGQRVSLTLDGTITSSIVVQGTGPVVVTFLNLAPVTYSAVAEVDGASSAAQNVGVPA